MFFAEKVDNKFGPKRKRRLKYFAKMAKDVIDSTLLTRDGIFKLLGSPGIGSKKLIQPAYVALAGRYDNPTLFLLGS